MLFLPFIPAHSYLSKGAFSPAGASAIPAAAPVAVVERSAGFSLPYEPREGALVETANKVVEPASAPGFLSFLLSLWTMMCLLDGWTWEP